MWMTIGVGVIVFVVLVAIVLIVWVLRKTPKTPKTPETREEFQSGPDNPLDLPWIASLTPLDMRARAGHVCVPLSTEPGPSNTTIERVPASCEAGMAHTQAGDRILLPVSIPAANEAETLRHELVHIDQRRHPTEWANFYARSWGFRLTNSPPRGLPAEWVQRRRSNPDTQFAGPWPEWRERFWVFAAYEEGEGGEGAQLQLARTVWWDAEDRVVRTRPPADWTAFFGALSQDEHPHEIAAVLMTAVMTENEAGRRLFNWSQSRVSPAQ